MTNSSSRNTSRSGSGSGGGSEPGHGRDEGSEHGTGHPALFALVTLFVFGAVGAGISLIFYTFVTARQVPTVQTGNPAKGSGEGVIPVFNPPPLADAPQAIQDTVKNGHQILMDTQKEVPNHVGNALNCHNCHFQGGMAENTLSLVGVAAKYPIYQPGGKGPLTLADKTNSCFQRNLNGTPLPADGKEMQALLTYYRWISKGVPIDADIPWLGLKHLQSNHKPDASAGERVFAEKCAVCHGENGQGVTAPPVWGSGSFSDGSQFNNVHELAAFDHDFMPRTNPDLTVPEALDVAAFLDSQPRPHFTSSGNGK